MQFCIKSTSINVWVKYIVWLAELNSHDHFWDSSQNTIQHYIKSTVITDKSNIFLGVNMLLFNPPNSTVRGANMGPIWGRQDPGGPHVGPINFAIWVVRSLQMSLQMFECVVLTHFRDWCLDKCRWSSPCEYHMMPIKMDRGNGLVSSGNRPSPDHKFYEAV